MSLDRGQLQHGATFTFGTDGGSWNLLSVGRYGEPIPVIDDTHMGTTTRRTKLPGDLADPQSLTIVVQNDSKEAYPTQGLAQTMTITYPLESGDSTAENMAGSGFIMDIRRPEFNVDTEAVQTLEIDIQYDGYTGPTRTVAS